MKFNKDWTKDYFTPLPLSLSSLSEYAFRYLYLEDAQTIRVASGNTAAEEQRKKEGGNAFQERKIH